MQQNTSNFRGKYQEHMEQNGITDIKFAKGNLFTFALIIGVPRGRVWQGSVSLVKFYQI